VLLLTTANVLASEQLTDNGGHSAILCQAKWPQRQLTKLLSKVDEALTVSGISTPGHTQTWYLYSKIHWHPGKGQ